MTLLIAFAYQVIMVMVSFIFGYFMWDDMPDSFWTEGIYYMLFIMLVPGTLFRWHFQIPLLGIGT